MIIAISGKFQSGKDTFTDILMEELDKRGYAFVKRSFADKLKRIVLLLCDLDISYYDRKEYYVEMFGMTLGQLYQIVGTECFRNHLDTETWVKALLGTYTPENNWIITDCRFKNEANAIKHIPDSHIIRIERPYAHHGSRDPSHASEIDLDDYPFDITIYNDKDLDHLRERARIIVNDLFC